MIHFNFYVDMKAATFGQFFTLVLELLIASLLMALILKLPRQSPVLMGDNKEI